MNSIVIIGATGGIGAALCRSLSQNGTPLFLGARDAVKLQALAEETGATFSPVDATDSESVKAFFQAAQDAAEGIDGVVSLAGSLLLKAAHQTSDEEWMQTIAQNLTSAFFTTRAAVKAMPQGGSIVLMSSVAARLGLANHEAIAAAKGGVSGLVLSAAATYAKQNIRVNAVAPGLVRTPLTKGLTSNEIMLKASSAMHPLNRIGEPEDVASLIAWLLDLRNSWITGQIIGCDGGLGSVRGR
ncbi:MAG TPA: SDR family oxidoreductase [Abditibacteriaceae bacterium]|jgi:NAD(P)-dependent dehydrogenase (short-subunit alcohol dehydrogenase family)